MRGFGGNIIFQILAAFLGTISFSLLFNVPKKYFIYCGITGTGAFIVYTLVNQGTSSIGAVFLASLTVTALSRIFAIRMGCPVTMFLISGIFPLVPGTGIYQTVYEIIGNHINAAVLYGLDTFKTAAAIALGIPIVLALPGKWFRFNR